MKRGAIAVVMFACGAAASSPTPSIDDETPADDPEDPADVLPVVAAAPPAASTRTALLDEAKRELGAVTESHYAHHTHVAEATGVFDFDCSGFVGYALSRVAPSALKAIVDASHPRPLAKHFEALFNDPHPPWTRVDGAADLVPGDVIAWLEPPAAHTHNTGHVMIVAGAPVPGKRSGELVVTVIDSSHSGHGAADARVRDHRNGLGTGKIILLIDAHGHAIGYRWSLWDRSVAYRTEVALGHLP